MKDENRIYWIAGSILVLTGAHYFTAMADVEAHDVFRRLYFVPIIYAAYSFGLRGGVATPFFVSLMYLPFILFRIHDPAQRFDQYLENRGVSWNRLNYWTAFSKRKGSI